MHKLPFILILLCSMTVNAQQLDHQLHNYGKVKEWNNPVAQFIYTNTSGTEQLFLPIAYRQDIGVKIEKHKLAPGESTVIHVLYYTEDFGRFDREISLFVNTQDQPIVMRVKGKIISLHDDAFTRCPSMDAPAPQVERFDHRLIVIDEETEETLSEFQLEWESSGHSRDEMVHGKSYQWKSIRPDLYRIAVDKLGYQDFEEFIYIYQSKPVTIVRLRKQASGVLEETSTELEPLMDEIIPDSSFLVIDQAPPHTERRRDSSLLVLHPPTPEDTAVASTEVLNPMQIKTNHIVFVIDVSSSMNKAEKLPLLKYSMSKLIEVLRPDDRVTILTYASGIQVLAENVSGMDKDQLLKIILSLEAKGQSYGSEALVEAYNFAQIHFIGDGNNEVILASDGLFNSVNFSKQREYRRAWYQEHFHEIRISTIGFGKSPYALEFLDKLADRGEGAFLRIPDEQLAETLLIENLIRHSQK